MNTTETTIGTATATPKNLITELTRIRRIAKSYGAEFTFNCNGAAVYLPEKAAPFIMESISDEFFQAGFIDKTADAEGLGMVLMEKCDDKTLGFTWK